MKRLLSLFAVVALLMSFTACKNNMRRDVKRLAHKTEQCFSKVDINDPMSSSNEEFSECYDELEELMAHYDTIYKGEEESVKFGRMYLEELQKTDIPQEFKDFFNFLYGLGDEGLDDFMNGEDPVEEVPAEEPVAENV